MLPQHYVYAALAAIVVATLYYKGYIRMPARAGAAPLFGPKPNSEALGNDYFEALRAEAEAEYVKAVQEIHKKLIKDRFLAPFAEPAPASPTPPGPGSP